MSDDSRQHRSLRDRLRALLTAEFEGLDPGHVAGVLHGMASELRQMSEAGIARISEIDSDASGWGGGITDEKPAFPVEAHRRPDVYELEAIDVERVEQLLDQILDLGAVVFAVEEAPPLNEIVDIRISLPTFHITIECKGRTVHYASKGTAFELLDLDKDDRVALESIRMDLAFGEPSEPSDVPDVPRPALDLTPLPSDESHGPWDSVLPGVNRRHDRGFRRQISLTQPDQKVLTSTQSRPLRPSTSELYGPGPPWFDLDAEPDRVERLADDRVIDILLQVSQQGLTGMIEIEGGGQRYQVLFDNGLVSEIAQMPRNADEELGLMLFRADRITKQQLAMAAAHADEGGSTVARSLLDLGILEPEQIRQSIAGRLTYLLQRICEFTRGEVSIYGGNSLPAGFLPNPPLRVHVANERVIFKNLTESLRQMPMREREEFQASYMDAYPEVVFQERDRVLRTLSEESHVDLVDSLLKGRRRLREVFTESGLSHAETFAVVHTLHRMGLVRFDRSLHHTIVRERYRENVTVKYLSVHKASYFEVLNVHWSSYSDVVRKAYVELVKQFDPEQVPANLESEVHERVNEIRDRIESAFQVLAERETRHAYRRRIMPEYKLAHAIPLFLKQAELAERRRNWEEARDALLRVVEIEPDHRQGRYRLDRVEAILDNRLSPDAADSNF